ncbi:hypothetical protein LXA54_16920 [Erwinia amylovora]|uniref:hypothetical protein n=1 Tax=Erwinia amylovora TaxID=552 RepID=UPI0020BF1908|nr:hypothetical protein [Erwinia amylovora]MCK8335972.1 hypothetical protein [Erwinia amylovora]
MSEDGKKITHVEIPGGLLDSEGSGKTAKDMELITRLKHKYIEKGIKITDDDPLIAILLGQDVLLDIYDMQISERINKRFDSLEKALSTFPVRVSDQLNERAENFLNLVEKVDNQVENHLQSELKSFQVNVRDYAQSTEKHLKSQNFGADDKKADPISYARVFGVSFIAASLAIALALTVFYYQFLN